MKMKMTRNDLKRFRNKICIGYCDLAMLLHSKEPLGYNSGIYGWNYDVYLIDMDTVIITGYRPMNCNIYPAHETIRRYEEQAKKLHKCYSWTEYKTLQIELDNLLNEFIKEVLVNG